MHTPGEAVELVVVECAMDELDIQLDIDPIELRRRNEPQQDPSQEIPFSTQQLIACMKKDTE